MFSVLVVLGAALLSLILKSNMGMYTKFNITFENKEKRLEIEDFLKNVFPNVERVGDKSYFFVEKGGTSEQLFKDLKTKYPEKNFTIEYCYEGDWSYEDEEIWKKESLEKLV